MLAQLGKVGVQKLKDDKVIQDTANIFLSPNGRPRPIEVPYSVTVFGLRSVPRGSVGQDHRHRIIHSNVRIIYRPRSYPLNKLDEVYTNMLDIADAITESWDRSETLRNAYIDELSPSENQSVTGKIMLVSMDEEPIERYSDFFYTDIDDDHAGLLYPAGYTLDLFFYGPGVADIINCP